MSSFVGVYSYKGKIVTSFLLKLPLLRIDAFLSSTIRLFLWESIN